MTLTQKKTDGVTAKYSSLQEKDSGIAMKTHQPYRLLERSIFCDRMVFVESLKDSNFMSEMELTIYDSW